MKKFQTKALILLIGNKSNGLTDVCPMLQKVGYDVLTANDGDEGFCLARRERPDLIVCEIALPNISGIELCYMVRADKYLESTPLILVGEPENQNGDGYLEGVRAGADDFFEAGCHSPFLTAKAARLIEFRRAEIELCQRRQNLNHSESRFKKIIEDASNLIAALESKINFSFSDKYLVKKSENSFNKSFKPQKNAAASKDFTRNPEFVDEYKFGNQVREKVFYDVVR